MKKRVFCILVAAIFCFAILPTVAWGSAASADSVPPSVYAADNQSFGVASNGTATCLGAKNQTFTGTKKMVCFLVPWGSGTFLGGARLNTNGTVYLMDTTSHTALPYNYAALNGLANVADISGGSAGISGGKTVAALTRDGRVVVATGSSILSSGAWSSWRDIVAMNASIRTVAGITKAGDACISGALGDKKLGWTDIVDVAVGDGRFVQDGCHIIGLKSDGTCVSYGTASAATNVAGWKDIVAVATSNALTVGVKKDGSVVVTGDAAGSFDFSGFTNIASVSCCSITSANQTTGENTQHILGLRKNGTVAATGYDNFKQCSDARKWNLGAANIQPAFILPGTTSISLKVGAAAALAPKVAPLNAADRSVLYSSANTAIAKVSGSGIVTAAGSGVTQITARASGNPAVTAVYTVIVAGSAVPGKPQSLTAKSTGYNSVALSWKKVTGATQYYVYRSVKKSSGYTLVAKVTGTACTNKSLVCGTLYYYKLKAVNKSGAGADSAVQSAKPVPAVTGSFKLQKKSATSLTAKWSAVSGASGYEIQYSTSKSFIKKTSITVGKVTAKTITKLAAGKTYYAKIRAYRTVSGKKIYGAYSKVLSLKLK